MLILILAFASLSTYLGIDWHEKTYHPIPHLHLIPTPDGIGFSDFFVSDGDDTAAALAVLYAAGHPIDPRMMYQFAKDDHFYAYTHELQPSVSATAHAVIFCISPPVSTIGTMAIVAVARAGGTRLCRLCSAVEKPGILGGDRGLPFYVFEVEFSFGDGTATQ